MSDFSEIESELKKLRPAQPSEDLAARIERALAEPNCRAGAPPAERRKRQPDRSPYNWFSLGMGLAAAAVLLLFVRISTEHRQENRKAIARVSPAPQAKSTVANEFIPVGSTQVVYHRRNEGLQFADGYEQPLRRLHYRTHQTLQWRNPATGASLQVSYPSDEVVLIPISGQ